MPNDDQAAFGVFPQMKPVRRGKSDIGDEIIDTLFIPHDPLDVAMMLTPYGKLGRAAAAGVMALTPTESEAGPLGRARKILKETLFHGGTYRKGDDVMQPLYLSPNKRLAASYVDESRNPGSTLQELHPNVQTPAPERLVNAVARRYVPENEKYGYTPASAFDNNLHDPALINEMIRELQSRGYDSAVAGDVSMGQGANSGAERGDALVLFPGSKAYAEGGAVHNEDFFGPMDIATLLTSFKGSIPASFAAYSKDLNPDEDAKLRAMHGPANFYQNMGTAIPQRNYRAPNPYEQQGKAILDYQDFKMRFPTPEMQKAAIESVNGYAGGGLRKSIQEMAEELMKKGVKVTDKPDLGRRSILGMGPITPPKDFPMTLHGDIDKAPKVVQKTTEIVPGGQKSTIESLAETPTSRRSILRSAASQAIQGALPGITGEMAQGLAPNIMQHVAPEAMNAVSSLPPVSIQGLIAHAIKMGLNEDATLDYIRHYMPHIDENDIYYMEPSIRDPYSVVIDEPMGPAQVMGNFLNTDLKNPMSMRGPMRDIRTADPTKYDELKEAARDFSDYGFED